MKSHLDLTTGLSGKAEFHFNRMEEILQGRPVGQVTVDGIDAVFINDPTLIRAIQVKDSRKYVRGDLFQKGRNISRAGLLLEDEASHRHYRRLSNPFLRVAKVDEYVPTMRRIVSDAVASWHAGDLVDIQNEMCWISGAIALAALFPSPFPEPSRDLSDRLAALILETIRKPLYGKVATPAQPYGLPSGQPAQAREEVRKLLFSYVDEQLRRPDSAAGYLSALLLDTDETGERVLTVDQICDEAIMMLIAATATMASVMSWALYVLSEEPLIEEKLFEDMPKAGNEGAAHGIERSSYTFRFLMEILRLYPPVWIACRKTRSSISLGDHLLPEGVNVIFSSYLLHRNSDRYPDAHRFDPDRWLSFRPGAGDDTSYIPFGIGPKACIGEAFAWRELEVILGTVMQRWRLGTKPGSSVQAAAETTLHPHELLMIPQPR
ncbi:cytochrome P450 [Phytohabitans rumicis]|uniref:Cytochrome P450 n=1 Tax=Phytohabitans rumicis TaxID=1076125 RepID=A0A6V8KQ64_9ACTN|nr:cytochrome P450 [Phytohabitans rumicis]